MATKIERTYQLIIDAGGSKAGAEMFRQSAEKISRAADEAAKKGKPITDNIAAQARAYERMRREIDPLYSAEVRLAQGLQLVETRLRTGQITTEEMARDVAALKLQFDRTAESARRMQGIASTGAGTYRNLGTAVQQAGFQVGDFAVQVASGQGMLRPFIQQGTQLISMFGPWGAVIGAAGAVVGALATSFLDLEDATEDATAALEAHNEAMRAAEELARALHGTNETSILGLEKTRDYSIELAEADLAAAEAKIALIEAMTMQNALEQSPDDIGRALDDVQRVIAAKTAAIRAEINGMYGEDGKYIDGIRGRLATLQFGTKDSRAPMDRFAVLGQDHTGSYADAAEAAKRLAEETAKANKETRELIATVAQADSHVVEYERLMDGLGNAVDRADAAGVADWNRTMAEGARVMEGVRTPAEAYAKTVERLNQIFQAGAIDNAEDYYRAIDQAYTAFEKASGGVDYFGAIADDAMGILQAGLVDAAFEADNLNDALSGVLKQLGKMLANKAFSMLFDIGLNAVFGSFGGGGLSGSISGMMAANPSIFHSGGRVGPGGPTRTVPAALFADAPRYHGGGQVGLRRNERAIIAEDGETIRTATQESALQAMLAQRGGGGGQIVNVFDQRSSKDSEPVEQRQRQGADGRAELDIFIRDANTRSFDRGGYDGVMARRYGITPVADKRRG